MSFLPDWASPPGETINDILTDRGISVLEFSDSMSISFTSAKRLLNGSLPLCLDLAKKLVDILGSTQNFWMRREEDYRNDLERISKIKDENLKWLSLLPTKDMVKQRWIQPYLNRDEKISACLEFFGVRSVDEWYNTNQSRLMQTAFRTSNSFDSTAESIITWLRKGEIESLNGQYSDWDPLKFREQLRSARELTRCKEPSVFIPQLKSLFSQCGVALAIAPTPSGCRASGATFFTDNNRAIVLLSFRHLSDDHFWFTLFHEAGHLLLHNQSDLFLEGTGANSKEEEEANIFSSDFLIPEEHKAELLTLNFKNWKKIPRFAKRIGVSSGIVVGQLQHLKIIEHHQLNKLKNRFKWSEDGHISAN